MSLTKRELESSWNPDDVSLHCADEEYAAWMDEVERNQRENEREAEEQAWRDQELLQDETDDT